MNAGSLSNEISHEELIQFEALAETFCQKTLSDFFNNETPDGNLPDLNAITNTAFTIGLAAYPDPESAGYDYGIWGKADKGNVLPSVLLLMKIAETCGGIASLFHWQGLGSNIFLEFQKEFQKQSTVPGKKIAVCIQEDFGLPSLKTLQEPGIDAPAKIKTTIKKVNGEYVLNGVKTFVYSMNEASSYIVFARYKNTWACANLDANKEGIIKSDPGVRTGLRACALRHIEFRDTVIPEEDIIFGNKALSLMKRVLFMNWTGLAAIAGGMAKGSVKKARQYASERYQGGTLIENHGAVQMLIADSEANAQACQSLAKSLSSANPEDVSGLALAAGAKLKCCEYGARAITDSLQVFGGYGYMEDFGMEKKLRDISVIKAGWGTPNFLKQFIFECSREV
ncbi:MAG: acyl-CoA dehydrogenase [bacterium]|nr:acyl-CoA dehydrogenase [bacterium]